MTILLQSASGGRAANGGMDRTGAPGSSGSCGVYCHHSTGLHPNTQISMELKDSLGFSVNTYMPEETYTLEFTVSSDGSPQGYGMQAVLLDSLEINAGTMLTASTSNTQITSLSNGRSFVEHDGINNSGIFKVTWKAPASGTGDITIYGIGLAADGLGTVQGDDFSQSTQLLLTEAIVSGIGRLENNTKIATAYPNPSEGTFFLQNNGSNGNWSIVITNVARQIVYERETYVEKGGNCQLELDELNAGVYFVSIEDGVRKEILKVCLK